MWTSVVQWGKSHLAAAFVIKMALSNPNSVGWVISPTYRQSGYLFEKVALLCKQSNIPITVKRSNQDMIITFTITGSKFQALSGDDPDKLRGQTLSYLIIDEAAMVNDELWTKHLRPMTAVFESPVIFISTPKGKNYFYDLYLLGKDGNNPQWFSCSYTSYDGIICAKDTAKKHPGKDELDSIKSETDDLTWRQEYLAEFLDSGGVVFDHYEPMPLQNGKYEDGHMYFCSIDLAKHTDYTVMFVADSETNEIVYYWRATGLSWESQLARFKEINGIYNGPKFFVDSTGLGDTIVERMVEEGLDTTGIVFSSKSKQQMVQNLAVMLQRGELHPPSEHTVLDELDRYTFEHTASGQFRYSAPDGYHDDCVSSLMILAWALSKVTKDIGFVTEEELSGKQIIKEENDIEMYLNTEDYDSISWDDYDMSEIY